MKNQLSKYLLITLIVIFAILLCVLIYVRFFANNDGNEYKILTDKVEAEIVFLDSSIIELMNKLNNISYTRYQVSIKEINESEQQDSSSSSNSGSSNKENESNENNEKSTNDEVEEAKTSKLNQTDSLLNYNYDNIAWEDIAYGIETIYTAWPSINMDLKALKMNDADIGNFSSILDGVAQSVKLQDKNSTLINLYNLYTLLPKFLSYFESDNQKINLYNTKAYVLSAYVSSNSDNWAEMNKNLSDAINIFSQNLQSEMIEEVKLSNLKKSYILLEELKTSVGLEDKEIFYLKYKLTMEQLEIL